MIHWSIIALISYDTMIHWSIDFIWYDDPLIHWSIDLIWYDDPLIHWSHMMRWSIDSLISYDTMSHWSIDPLISYDTDLTYNVLLIYWFRNLTKRSGCISSEARRSMIFYLGSGAPETIPGCTQLISGFFHPTDQSAPVVIADLLLICCLWWRLSTTNTTSRLFSEICGIDRNRRRWWGMMESRGTDQIEGNIWNFVRAVVSKEVFIALL